MKKKTTARRNAKAKKGNTRRETVRPLIFYGLTSRMVEVLRKEIPYSAADASLFATYIEQFSAVARVITAVIADDLGYKLEVTERPGEVKVVLVRRPADEYWRCLCGELNPKGRTRCANCDSARPNQQ